MGRHGRKKGKNMKHDFEYVKKSEYMPAKKQLINLLNDVQDELRDDFTFQFYFIGSTNRNMITRDKKSNVGFDFDIDCYPNASWDTYKAKVWRDKLINAINKHVKKYGYATCENSTRVITIKVKDKQNSRILYSCDIAIAFDFDDDSSYYIYYNKKQNSFDWKERPNPYEVEEKADDIKEEGYWEEVKDLYIYLKNNSDKKSRSLYAEAVNDVYNQYFNM